MKQWDMVFYVMWTYIHKCLIKEITDDLIFLYSSYLTIFAISKTDKNLFEDFNKAKKRALDNLDKQISVYLSEMEEKRKEILFKFI